MTQKITFKSIPEYWKKEYLGLKSNTVRKLNDKTDPRREIIINFMNNKKHKLFIEIKNTETLERFTRTITDVTKYGGFYIISWKDIKDD